MTQPNATLRVVSGLGDAPDRQPTNQSGPVALAALQLDPRTYDRALDCVHCGLCLPACPTYTENGLEADSPRGRIYLMKGLADGKIDPSDSVLGHLELCLDCHACETACPSGVVYHELIEQTRGHLLAHRKLSAIDRLVQMIFFHLFTDPNRLKLAILPARILQRIGLWRLLAAVGQKLLPAQLAKMQQMLPSRGPLWQSNLREKYSADPKARADGKSKATVGFLAGCVGSVVFQDINRETIALLQHAGCDVLVPKAQVCCGAIHHHGGKIEKAAALARTNIEAFEGVDFIVNNAAGCGAMLKDYAHLLRDDAQYAERAKAFVKRTRDISELLIELKPSLPTNRLEQTVTYHDACHLVHAQRLAEPPRQLLGWIPGLTVVDLSESDMCCGAAGTYNLSQPQMARQLAERKIKHIQSTNATTCVTGNVGCAMQIQSEAERLGIELQVVHPVSLLYQSYFADRTKTGTFLSNSIHSGGALRPRY